MDDDEEEAYYETFSVVAFRSVGGGERPGGQWW